MIMEMMMTMTMEIIMMMERKRERDTDRRTALCNNIYNITQHNIDTCTVSNVMEHSKQ